MKIMFLVTRMHIMLYAPGGKKGHEVGHPLPCQWTDVTAWFRSRRRSGSHDSSWSSLEHLASNIVNFSAFAGKYSPLTL